MCAVIPPPPCFQSFPNFFKIDIIIKYRFEEKKKEKIVVLPKDVNMAKKMYYKCTTKKFVIAKYQIWSKFQYYL